MSSNFKKSTETIKALVLGRGSRYPSNHHHKLSRPWCTKRSIKDSPTINDRCEHKITHSGIQKSWKHQGCPLAPFPTR